jgi:hypothetical protein
MQVSHLACNFFETAESRNSYRAAKQKPGRLAFRPGLFNFAHRARVVKWQTRTFEGRMPKGMGVQVPPRAFLPPAHNESFSPSSFVSFESQA